jgi:divalent metal cation (Fe/Co/Zn/Cd) transporter
LRAVAREFSEVIDVHDFEFKRVAGKLYVSCHCTMSDTLPLSQVHEIMTALETRFKLVDPELFRVLIHPEPQTDNFR